VRLRAAVRPAAEGIAIALGITGAAFALLALGLPRTSEDDRLALRVLAELRGPAGIRGAELQIGTRRLIAHCRKVAPGRSVVTISNGARLVVRGTRIKSFTGARSSGRALTSRAALEESELRSAQVDLAGIRGLYAAQLRGRLLRGEDVYLGETTVAGVSAHRFRLGRDQPRLELLVEQETLTPLAARYESRRLKGMSRLLPATGRRRAC